MKGRVAMTTSALKGLNRLNITLPTFLLVGLLLVKTNSNRPPGYHTYRLNLNVTAFMCQSYILKCHPSNAILPFLDSPCSGGFSSVLKRGKNTNRKTSTHLLFALGSLLCVLITYVTYSNCPDNQSLWLISLFLIRKLLSVSMSALPVTHLLPILRFRNQSIKFNTTLFVSARQNASASSPPWTTITLANR